MNPKISIIIPVHNAGEYLPESLQSVIEQTFTQWECIIINDGSTDQSLSIIKKYSKLDSRIKYFNIEHSGSADIARFTGVNLASSDLVIGLDADDYLSTLSLELLYNRISETGADIVYQRSVYFDQKTKQEMYSLPVKEFNMGQVLSGAEACSLTIGGWQISLNGLMKKSLYNKIPAGKLLNSDEYTNRERLLTAEKIAFCNTNYFVRLHATSSTHLISVKLFDRLITDHLLEKMVKNNYSEGSGVPKKMRKERLINLMNHQVLYTKIKTHLSPKEQSTVHKILKTNFQNQSIEDLRRELPFHWKITFLTSYLWFSIGSILYFKIKPSKLLI